MMDGLCAGLCACWLLPLGLLGGLALLSHAMRVGWRHRGLEKGTLYCASCRFNLRGCASWNCPECGGHLDAGRVVTPGHDPPMALGVKLLLMTVAVIGPAVFACVLLAQVMPFHYVVDRTVHLTPETLGRQVDLTVKGDDARQGFGRARPERLELFVSRYGTSRRSGEAASLPRVDETYQTPLPASDDVMLPDDLWARIVLSCGIEDQPADWLEDARAELASMMRYVAGEVKGQRPAMSRYLVHSHNRSRFEPYAWFVLLEIALAIVVWALLMRAVVRLHGLAFADYAYRHRTLTEKLDAWIQKNRTAAGLDREREP